VTLIELIWTITPALILIAIAFPSFRLLYLLDSLLEYTDIYTFMCSSIFIREYSHSILLNTKLRISNNSVTKLRSNCLSLILFGIVLSNVGIRLNKHCRDITVLQFITREQIIGHLLGDGGIYYSRTSKIPYFTFTQTVKRFEYLWYSFNLLSFLCESYPDTYKSIRKGTMSQLLRVRTRSYPFFY
jgi:heme/copper-type cytochrome/quinol oxidase subunit 2